MIKVWFEQVKSWIQTQVSRLESSRVMDGTQKEQDEHHYARLGWIVVLVGFGGFMLWATFAPLDQGGQSAVEQTLTVIPHGDLPVQGAFAGLAFKRHSIDCTIQRSKRRNFRA